MTISGCAFSTGRPFEMKEDVTSDKVEVFIFHPYMSYWSSGVFQDSALMYVDDEAAARLGEGMYTRILVVPGKHRFHTSADWQMACHSQLFPDFTWPPVDLLLESKRVYFLRYARSDYKDSQSRALSCDKHLLLVPNQEALLQIQNTKYVTPKNEIYD